MRTLRFHLADPPTHTHTSKHTHTQHSYTYVGNWYSYTVNVEEPGTYSATFFGSSHHGGWLSFDVDYKDQTGNVSVESTGVSRSGWLGCAHTIRGQGEDGVDDAGEKHTDDVSRFLIAFAWRLRRRRRRAG